MKKCLTITVLLTAVILFVVSAVPSWSAKKVNIAMVLWRGMTEAEEGFQVKLKKYQQYDINFTVLDANQDKKELARIIDTLDTSKYQVIYVFGTTATKAVKGKVTDIPIVFNIVARPVEAKIIDSWEHPGSNITGASNAVPMASAFSTISKVLTVKRLGFIYNPKEVNSMIQRDELVKLQTDFGYELVDAPIEGAEKIPMVVQKVIDAKVDAVIFPQDSLVKDSAEQIIPHLNIKKIPTIATIPEMVKDNKAFIGLGHNYFDLGQMAADKVLAILEGKKTNDIPSTMLNKLHMTVNLTTAQEIGVNVPVQLLRISTVVR